MKRHLAAVAVAVLTALIIFSPAGRCGDAAFKPDDLLGKYSLLIGTTPLMANGLTADEAEITKLGEAYRIVWKTNDGKTQKGLGILFDDELGVVFGGPEPMGLVIYKIDGGKLSAKWCLANYSSGALYTYTMQGSADLKGEYLIDGGKGNKVILTPTAKNIYTVEYVLDTGTYKGVAVKDRDYLVAVTGSGKNFGAGAYICSKANSAGNWVSPGMTETQPEVLSR